jgi:hypothetical protein
MRLTILALLPAFLLAACGPATIIASTAFTTPSSPTFEPSIDLNQPTAFEDLYYSKFDGGITGAVAGGDIEKNNSGIKGLTVDGAFESQINALINRNFLDITAGFSVDSNYLIKLFKDEGIKANLVDNVWVDDHGNIFNPYVANRIGHPYGYPILGKENGVLVGAISDLNGVLVVGSSWEPIFKKPANIAFDAGFTGDITKVSRVGLDQWGNIAVFDKDDRTIVILPYLYRSAVAFHPTDTPILTEVDKKVYIEAKITSVTNQLPWWNDGNWSNVPDMNGDGTVDKTDIVAFRENLSKTVFTPFYQDILKLDDWEQADIEALTPYNLYKQASNVAIKYGFVVPADLFLTGQMVGDPQGVANSNIEGGNYGLISGVGNWDLTDLTHAASGFNYYLTAFGINVQVNHAPSEKILANDFFIAQTGQNKYVLIAHYFNTSPIDGKTSECFIPVSIFFGPTTISHQINAEVTDGFADMNPVTIKGVRDESAGFPYFYYNFDSFLKAIINRRGEILINVSNIGENAYNPISDDGLEVAVSLIIPQKPSITPSLVPTP